jgi:DNA-directed RNA polymerase subunit L
VKLNVILEDGDRMEMEVGGEGHTFLNLLQSYLLADKSVEMAGYTKYHPLMDKSLLIVKLGRGKNYKRALTNNSEKASKALADFSKKFQASLEKQKK